MFTAIRFSPALEDLALRRIDEGDFAGARSALGLLVGRLDLSGPLESRGEAALLLVDLLLTVNRRAHGSRRQAGFQTNRLAILRSFSGPLEPEDARRRFLPTVDWLLSRGVFRSPEPPEGLVDRARAVVRSDYARPLSLARVAAALGVSPGYLSRVFRRETGATLTSYIHSVRLQHALLLLASGGRSLSEVASLVGYQSYRDFYRNFMKQEQASPRHVRDRLGGPFAETG